jgi:hypothetical protein
MFVLALNTSHLSMFPYINIHVQWVDCYFWLLVLDSRDSKHKLEVTRLGQVVQNRFQKMNIKKKFQNL